LIARIHPVLAAAVRAAGGAALFAAVDAGVLLTYLLSESDKSPVVLVASRHLCSVVGVMYVVLQAACRKSPQLH